MLAAAGWPAGRAGWTCHRPRPRRTRRPAGPHPQRMLPRARGLAARRQRAVGARSERAYFWRASARSISLYCCCSRVLRFSGTGYLLPYDA